MKKSVFLAVLIAVAAVLWVASGMVDKKAPASTPTLAAQSKTADADKQPFRVRVKELTAQNYVQTIILNGRSRANTSVTLRAETDGKIFSLGAKEGEEVSKGQEIAIIDPEDRAERVGEARSLLARRQIEYNAAKSLETRGFNSKIALAEAANNLDSAKTALKRAQDDLSKTRITAPFDGVLTQRMIERGDYVRLGDSLITLVNLDPIEVVGYVSEHKIQQIRAGSEAIVSFRGSVKRPQPQDSSAATESGSDSAVSRDAGGVSARTGRITYIAPVANVEARTFEIHIRLDNNDKSLIDGLTVEISIPLEPRSAYRISPSVLTLGPQGQIGVKIVDDANIVRFHAVEILADTAGDMWVSGLPDSVRLITLGQDFVSDGSTVTPVIDDGNGLL